MFVGEGKSGDTGSLSGGGCEPRAPRSRPLPRTCRPPSSMPWRAIYPGPRSSSISSISIQLYNDKLTDLRRELYREDHRQLAEKRAERHTLAAVEDGRRTSTPNHNEPEQCLQECLDLNQPLATAYYLKERPGRSLGINRTRAGPASPSSIWSLKRTASGIHMLQNSPARFLHGMGGDTGLLRSPDHRPVPWKERTTKSKP